MNAMSPAKVLAFAIFFCVFAPLIPAQTPQQVAQAKSISELDWTDTLDYFGWLLDTEFWIDHPQSEYAKQFFAELNLSAADDTAFRTIVADFGKRHEQLMAEHYAKLNRNDWTPEAETKLIHDLIDATNQAIQRIRTDMSPDGVTHVRNAFI